jgi:hypothetical protein
MEIEEFCKMTEEDREIWKKVKERCNLWALNLLSRDHWADVVIFQES